LTTNPGVSLHKTGLFPNLIKILEKKTATHPLQKSVKYCTVCGLVPVICTTSTNFIIGTGLKKWSPPKLPKLMKRNHFCLLGNSRGCNGLRNSRNGKRGGVGAEDGLGRRVFIYSPEQRLLHIDIFDDGLDDEVGRSDTFGSGSGCLTLGEI
jgi:hypothetical protein